jgi:N-acetylmuramoyl-L-alanine amidase
VSTEHGQPALPAARLAELLPLTQRIDADWAMVTFGGQPFRFLLNAGLFLDHERIVPLVAGAYTSHDTLFLPLQWLADYVPRVFQTYRYDPLAFRFEEAQRAPVVQAPPRPAPASLVRAPRPNLPPGSPLRMAHKVVIDPGHGGDDPGNPGLAFPAGIREKDVNLAISRALKGELEYRGVTALLTRTADVLIDLRERARTCDHDCDLFVSVHVNSMPRRAGYQQVDGIETYFLNQSRTAEARRVAAMENDALRYETGPDLRKDDQFSFILKDLQTNEYLRESAALAEAVQQHGARVHPGPDRGVSQAGFVVLSTARRPAILVETGYSTNPSDARFLASAEGQQRLARGLADGIVAYLVQYERKIAATTPR